MFGARVKRIEDPALLRGRGRFVDDITFPDLLHAAFVRSPLAHARVRGLDKTPALALPGVHAVLTLADLRPHMANARRPVVFFSSRRRHTRFDCDWSSDVCSSD